MDIQKIQEQIEDNLDYYSRNIVLQRISENMCVCDDKAQKEHDILDGLYSLICEIGNLKRLRKGASE